MVNKKLTSEKSVKMWENYIKKSKNYLKSNKHQKLQIKN
jgi:hypothetical protein